MKRKITIHEISHVHSRGDARSIVVSQDTSVVKRPSKSIGNVDEYSFWIGAFSHISVKSVDLLYLAQRFTVVLMTADAFRASHCLP